MPANLRYLNESILKNIDHKVEIIHREKYTYCSYKLPLNLFTFGKFYLNLPFTVIAPPISIDDVGFSGDISALITDLKKSKSSFSLFPKIFIFLNLREEQKVAAIKSEEIFGIGHTLSSCIFTNQNPLTDVKFESINEYKSCLRSSYKRRIQKAEKRGEDLCIQKIDNINFNEELYELYLQVLQQNMKYKLETLPISFFKHSLCDIYVWKKEGNYLSFVMISENENTTHFVFGGLNYQLRDTYDLYYNMLLFILKKGLGNQSEQINFGQTAEETKCRLGCISIKRYMLCFSTSPFLTLLIKKIHPILAYKPLNLNFRVFKFLPDKK